MRAMQRKHKSVPLFDIAKASQDRDTYRNGWFELITFAIVECSVDSARRDDVETDIVFANSFHPVTVNKVV